MKKKKKIQHSQNNVEKEQRTKNKVGRPILCDLKT